MSYLPDPSGCISISIAFAASKSLLVPGCVITLIPWRQANVVIDRRGRARLTEYGLAPVNSDPSFTVAATPGAVGTSRWLAPEIINPPRKGNCKPVMESKPADTFSFGMLVVEVFTGEVPFGEIKNEEVVLRILRGGRPEMPANAQAAGLTGGVWKLLESCWEQNPKKRPTMKEVVRRWEKFVELGSDGVNIVTECVRVALAIRIATFSTFYGRLRTQQPSAGPTPGTDEPRTDQPQTTSEVRQQTNPEAVRMRTPTIAIRSQTLSATPRPSKSLSPGGYQSQVLMYRLRSAKAQEEVVLRSGLSP